MRWIQFTTNAGRAFEWGFKDVPGRQEITATAPRDGAYLAAFRGFEGKPLPPELGGYKKRYIIQLGFVWAMRRCTAFEYTPPRGQAAGAGAPPAPLYPPVIGLAVAPAPPLPPPSAPAPAPVVDAAAGAAAAAAGAVAPNARVAVNAAAPNARVAVNTAAPNARLAAAAPNARVVAVNAAVVPGVARPAVNAVARNAARPSAAVNAAVPTAATRPAAAVNAAAVAPPAAAPVAPNAARPAMRLQSRAAPTPAPLLRRVFSQLMGR